MNKKTVWLTVATVLVLVGLVMFSVVMTALGWDFSRLSTMHYESVTYDIDDAFQSISIDTETADITFVPVTDGGGRIVVEETEKITYSVSVKEGVLTVCLVDKRELFDYIELFSTTPKMTVYLPAGGYESLTIKESTGDVEIPMGFSFDHVTVELSTGDVTLRADVKEQARIKTSTGDILVEHLTAESLDLRTTTGDIRVEGTICHENMSLSTTTGEVSVSHSDCASLTTDGTTGDLWMSNVIAKECFSIERGTGDVTLDACDAAEISVRTTTGDVTGTLLSPKTFEANATTGDVEVPSSGEGGKCVINTTTGDIFIKIK